MRRFEREWPAPADVTALCSFLGLASYYWRYIPHCADVAAPRYHLAHTFQRLKDLLITAPVLAYPQFQDGASAFILYTDASNSAVNQTKYVVACN